MRPFPGSGWFGGKYPSQLAKENKKFVYGVIREGARAKDLSWPSGGWWIAACLSKSHRVSNQGLLWQHTGEISVFKLFLHDVGLLGAMAGLDVRTIIEGDEIFASSRRPHRAVRDAANCV